MRTTITASALLLLLTACGGGESGDDPNVEQLVDDYPPCSEVWVPGETLPEDYEGCDDGETIMAAVWTECTDGTRLTTYDDRMWSLGDGPIKEGPSSSEEYADDYAACTG